MTEKPRTNKDKANIPLSQKAIFDIIQSMLSVVVVSYNTKEITLQCLRRLKEADEVIVVDNASEDGSAEAIKNKFPKVRLIANKKNAGFAGANNQGMREARGEWILLLNSDAYVLPETLPQMKKFMITHPVCDVAGCQLVNADGTIQASYGFFPTLRRIVLFMLFVDNFPFIRRRIDSIHVRDKSRYATTVEVDWVTGAFIWLKREVWEKTGGLDEKYFMYGEEAEWMYRIKKAGFKVFYTPQAKCIHLQGKSTKSLAKAFAGEAKGFLYWFSKHNPRWQQLILPWILLAGGIYKAIAWTVLGNRQWARANWGITDEIWHATFGKSK